MKTAQESTEWTEYLKESGNYDSYHGDCNCCTCRAARNGFPDWRVKKARQSLLFALTQERERYAWIRGELEKVAAVLKYYDEDNTSRAHKELTHIRQISDSCDDAIANIQSLLQSVEAVKGEG